METLTGTEKQIVWAAEIRSRQIAALETKATELEAKGKEIFSRMATQFREAIPVLLWERRAAKWIEHKSDDVSQLVGWASDLQLVGEKSIRSLA